VDLTRNSPTNSFREATAPVTTAEPPTIQPGTTREIPITIEPEPEPTVPEMPKAPAAGPTPAPTATTPPRSGSAQNLYPHLPQIPPNMQQMMNGIANTVGNATRNIPILQWSPLQPTAPAPAVNPTPQQQPTLNEHMTQTVNQLLSMGFSNHDGHLARLVLAKNGNLDETLNALFPQGQ
jgi:hypothetical protein